MEERDGQVEDEMAKTKAAYEMEVDEGDKLCALLYADDICLMTENKKDLQILLDTVYEYCKKWRFELNIYDEN